MIPKTGPCVLASHRSMSQKPASLPLPIATLVRRARNATDPTRKHLAAYYAWEASIRLAVAAEPKTDVTALVVPSVGHWVRAMPERKASLTDGALIALHTLLSEVGMEQRSTPKSTSAQKLFSMLPPYRNKVIGHGSTRADAFNQDAARIFLDAIEPAWRAYLFFPEGATLFYVERVAIDTNGDRRAHVLRLEGLASEREGELLVSEDVLPGRVYLRRDEMFLPLYPWVLFEPGEERERTLFFNSFKSTGEYLDYATGDVLKSKALSASFPTLDADLAALFEGAIAKRPTPSVRPPAASPAQAEEAPKPNEPAPQTSPDKPKSRMLGALAGVGVLALVGAGVWLGTRRPPTPPSATPSPSASAPAQEADLLAPHVSDDPLVQEEFRRGVEALLSADIFAAENAFLSVAEKAKGSPWPHLGVSMTAGLQSHFEDSNRAHDEALALMRGLPQRDSDLLVILDAADKDWKRGKELWATYKQANPRFLWAHVVALYFYLQSDSREERAARLADARAIDDRHAFLYLLEARAEMRLNDPARGLSAIEKGIVLQPASAWLLAYRGMLRMWMGDTEKGRADLEQAVARRGPFSAHRSYAFSLLASGKPEDEAQFAKERETLLATKNIEDRLDFMCAHPLLLLQIGRVKEADKLLDAAVEVAREKRKQGTVLRCLVLPAFADIALSRLSNAEAKMSTVSRVWEELGLASGDEQRGKVIAKVIKATIAAERGSIEAAQAELEALEKQKGSGSNEVRYVIALAKKEPMAIPDPAPNLPKSMQLRLLRLKARSLAAQGKNEDAEKVYASIAKERESCGAVVFDTSLVCGPYVADAMVELAGLRLARGAKDEAKQSLDDLAQFWPKADSDLLLMKRAVALRKQLGNR